MYEAHIEANMPDDDIAELLSTDQGWLEAQWPECIRQAEAANQTVTGDPVLQGYEFTSPTSDGGRLYDFTFEVPTE